MLIGYSYSSYSMISCRFEHFLAINTDVGIYSAVSWNSLLERALSLAADAASEFTHYYNAI